MNPTFLYIAAVYAIAVALARRARIDLPWRVAGVFYLLVLAFFFRPMTGRYVNTAPEVLRLAPPWSASAPAGFDKFDVSNFELQDVTFQLLPWAHQVREQWRALEVPLWNDLVGCGMPLMANMQSAPFSPLRLLALPLPLAYAWTAEEAMKILVALTFTFLYCRRRYDVWPSLVGAIAFGFGTFMIAWLQFPHATVAAFLPAVLYMIDLLAERVTIGRFAFAAVLGPVLLAGGHPETAAHIVFFALLYAAWVIFAERVKLLRTLLAVSAVSLLLAAPILLPFLEALPLGDSYQQRRAESHAGGTAFSDFHSLALLVHPRIYGERPGPLWGNTVTETVSGFAGILGIAAFFGLIARAIRRADVPSAAHEGGRDVRLPQRETFLLIAAVLLFLWIADAPFVSAPLRALFSIALNARLRLLLSFVLAVLSAALVQSGRNRVPAIGGALAVIAFVMIRTPFPNAEARNFAIAMLVPSLIVLALLLSTRRARFITVPLLAIAVYAELWQAAHGWNPVSRGTELYPRTPLIEALQRQRGPEPYRIAGIGAPLFPNTNALFGFEDARVKDPLASAEYMRLLRQTKGWDPKAYYEKWSDPDTPLLDELNVKWLLTERGVELADRARYRLLYDGADGRIYENTRARPRFHARDAFMSIAKTGSGAYDLHIDAAKETLVTSSVAHWPGWRITHDGKRLRSQLVNGAFLGFTVPKGSGLVRVRYAPWSFRIGVILALATVVGFAVARFRGFAVRGGQPRDRVTA
ncbi:MAG TPA: YfhO family protein [Thermoanaerobaculia bacterium]|nr:YfhO family protein [Thermoanaerobaculia bacterium]